ncbi:fimbrial protein [Pseudomonas lactis]|uniref:Fimbrial protein n=1 Tax=Pseudomonas lactis TaxID=1615674 RepID=I4KAA6_9PSED|nr:fimbrial protein [Pseudomonas lactis]
MDLKNSSLFKTNNSAKGVGIGMYYADSIMINLSANQAYISALVWSGGDESTNIAPR